MCTTHLATHQPIFHWMIQMVTRTKKVFVGGLSAQTTLDDVRAYFEQFGLVSIAQATQSGSGSGTDNTTQTTNRMPVRLLAC